LGTALAAAAEEASSTAFLALKFFRMQLAQKKKLTESGMKEVMSRQPSMNANVPKKRRELYYRS
jgi:hypothetical protein